jgi:hypothetical protein
MKLAIVYGLLAGLVLVASVPGLGSGVGFTAGFEPTGLWILGALTELSITEMFDLRAQIGFASQSIEGLMLAGISMVPHWPMPPVDPFVGLGVGVALTPPPYTTGIVVEGAVGIRLIPADVISILLQARYLLRWTGSSWTTGPVFEGGILMRF